MTFYKEQCYSTLNAEEVLPGDYVICADTLGELQEVVEETDDEYSKQIHIVKEIREEQYECRFRVDNGINYALCYKLDEDDLGYCGIEPELMQPRAYTVEDNPTLIGDTLYYPANDTYYKIIQQCLGTGRVMLGGLEVSFTYEELFQRFRYPNGQIVGINPSEV